MIAEALDRAARLRSLASVARTLERTDIADDATDLATRVEEGRFFVACVGQFKRGKSTMLNALLDAPVLPVGVIPVTAIVTVVRFGNAPAARVRLADGGWRAIEVAELHEFVTEARNPRNSKGIVAVEVLLPSEVLRDGACLVDTPGLGSTFLQNDAATREFVPHVDAAIVVIGADPPMSGQELELIRNVQTETREIVLALNKADRLAPDEVEEARSFAHEVLQRELGLESPIFAVSAAERTRLGPTREWAKMETAIRDLAKGRAALLSSAAERGLQRLSSVLTRELDERRRALDRPIVESERRIADLDLAVRDAHRLMIEMSYLFQAVQDEIARRFERERSEFVARELTIAVEQLEAWVGREVTDGHRDVATRAMEEARSVARQRVERWRHQLEPLAESLYREASERFVGVARELIMRAANADETLTALARSFQPELGFRTKPKFYFTEMLTLGGPTGSARLAALTGKKHRSAAIAHDAAEYLRRLFETNSHRVANDFSEQVLESRRRLQADLRRHLDEGIAAARGAVDRARQILAGGAEMAAAEHLRLDESEHALERVAAGVARPLR